MQDEKILILGAGIAGLAAAIALKNAGKNFTIYEASPEIKPVGAGLGLGANAIKGFQYLQIDQEVTAVAKQLRSLVILDQKGKKITESSTINIRAKYGIDNYAIHRAHLHEVLLQHAGMEHVQLSKKAERVESEADGVTVHFSDNTSVSTQYLIAAEGINSTVRQQLYPGSVPRYAGYTCWRAVVSAKHLKTSSEASETWGNHGRFGIVPLANHQIYWFACVRAKQNDPITRSWSIKELAENFKEYHQPIGSIIDQTAQEQLIHNDIYDIKPISRYAYGNTLLIGDAAHATTPNMGQGACQAIEDAACLSQLLKTGHSLPDIFKQFEQLRLKRTHWIINRSRSLGNIAQTTKPLITGVRNLMFRVIPESFNEKQMEFLYNVKF